MEKVYGLLADWAYRCVHGVRHPGFSSSSRKLSLHPAISFVEGDELHRMQVHSKLCQLYHQCSTDQRNQVDFLLYDFAGSPVTAEACWGASHACEFDGGAVLRLSFALQLMDVYKEEHGPFLNYMPFFEDDWAEQSQRSCAFRLKLAWNQQRVESVPYNGDLCVVNGIGDSKDAVSNHDAPRYACLLSRGCSDFYDTEHRSFAAPAVIYVGYKGPLGGLI